jgi:hypothetical protein
MSSDITSEETEEVELTEKDLDVIDEINQENEPEETTGGDDEQSVAT